MEFGKIFENLKLKFFNKNSTQDRNANAKSKNGKAAATTGDHSPIQMDETNIINNINIESPGRGGDGGSPTAIGNNNTIIGGQGGAGGPGAKGGNGGGGVHHGDNLVVMGGEGGEAGQFDRGGKGGRSPFEILGYPNIQLPDGTKLWDKGRGGNGFP